MFLFLFLFSFFSLPVPAAAELPPKRIEEEYRSLSPEQAFYLSAQVAGVALLEGNLDKARKVWMLFAHLWPRHALTAPAAIQMALIARLNTDAEEESRRLFQRVAEAPGKTLLLDSCRETARRWLARSQIASLRAAMDRYYISHLEYPATLAELALGGWVKSNDLVTPWGRPPDYRRTRSDLFPDTPGQAYELSSGSLAGPLQPEKEILEAWRSNLPRWVLWGIATTFDGRPSALLGFAEQGSKAGNKVSVPLGEKFEGLTLVNVDQVGAILGGPDFLFALPQRLTGAVPDSGARE
ncbi:MAG: hypothetical protein HYU36_14860 [Planctomycetes bacterium]|nr:hypothetical protein [Planctomycetota bacterium]